MEIYQPITNPVPSKCWLSYTLAYCHTITVTSQWARWRLKSPASRLSAYSDADQRKHQSSASVAFVRGTVNSPHKWPVTREIFPFDDVIMTNMGKTSTWRTDTAMTLRCQRRYCNQRAYAFPFRSGVRVTKAPFANFASRGTHYITK